jgi:hypothetical protein
LRAPVQQFLRLCGFAFLDLAELGRSLFSRESFAAEDRFQGAHQQHLKSYEFGEYMAFHLCVVSMGGRAEKNLPRPFACGLSVLFRSGDDLPFLVRCQLGPDAAGARHTPSQSLLKMSAGYVAASHVALHALHMNFSR